MGRVIAMRASWLIPALAVLAWCLLVLAFMACSVSAKVEYKAGVTRAASSASASASE
jgi:hypothetical protein